MSRWASRLSGLPVGAPELFDLRADGQVTFFMTGTGGERLDSTWKVIAAARAFRAEDTDWDRVAELYGELARRAPSPVAELNRAAAVGMAAGPSAGLELVNELAVTGTLARYHLFHSVRGDLLEKLDRWDEAAEAFAKAAQLAQNAQERQLLLDRAAAAIARRSEGRPPNAREHR